MQLRRRRNAGATDDAMPPLTDDAACMPLHHLPPSTSAEDKLPLVDAIVSLWHDHGVLPLSAAEAAMRADLKHDDVGYFYFQSDSRKIIAAAAYYLNPNYLESGCNIVWLSACALHGQTQRQPSPSPAPSPAPNQEIVTAPNEQQRGLGSRLFNAVRQVRAVIRGPGRALLSLSLSLSI